MKTREVSLYIPDRNEVLHITCGTGDQLLKEDIADGYVDYVDFARYAYDNFSSDDLPEDNIDGGIVLYRRYIDNVIECIPDVLWEAYDDKNIKYEVMNRIN